MNKKKALTLVTALTLVAVVGVGATLAYFTDKAEVSNVFTMGHVDVTLTENLVEKDENGEYVQTEAEDDITNEGLEFEDVRPGQTVPKNPTITVEDGSEDCYVRATFEVAFEDENVDSKYADALTKSIRDYITAEGSDWTYVEDDGYYYYAYKLQANTDNNKAVLFDKVTIPGAEWDNAVADKKFTIKINAEAIQADNFEPETTTVEDETGNEVTYISGWHGVTAENYPAPTPDAPAAE